MSTGACMPARSSGLLGDQSDGRILGEILRFPAWQQPRAQKQKHADSQQNESQSDEDARVGEIAEHAQVPLRIDAVANGQAQSPTGDTNDARDSDNELSLPHSESSPVA